MVTPEVSYAAVGTTKRKSKQGTVKERRSLHLAARSGQKGIAELLLINGAMVNAKDRSGLTPLHSAALNGHKDFIEVLLANNADVNTKDNMGQTPLNMAADRGHAKGSSSDTIGQQRPISMPRAIMECRL